MRIVLGSKIDWNSIGGRVSIKSTRRPQNTEQTAPAPPPSPKHCPHEFRGFRREISEVRKSTRKCPGYVPRVALRCGWA